MEETLNIIYNLGILLMLLLLLYLFFFTPIPIKFIFSPLNEDSIQLYIPNLFPFMYNIGSSPSLK